MTNIPDSAIDQSSYVEPSEEVLGALDNYSFFCEETDPTIQPFHMTNVAFSLVNDEQIGVKEAYRVNLLARLRQLPSADQDLASKAMNRISNYLLNQQYRPDVKGKAVQMVVDMWKRVNPES